MKKPTLTVDVVVAPYVTTCPDCGRPLKLIISTHEPPDTVYGRGLSMSYPDDYFDPAWKSC